MSDQQGMSFGLFQWIIGVLGVILTGAASVMWARQNAMDNKVDAMEVKIAGHTLEDERQFAKKDDVRHLYEIITRELTELKDNQERNLQRVMDKLDQIMREGK